MAKILFIQNYGLELCGIMSIASYIKDKHQVKIAIGSYENINQKISTFKPDVVGIHVLSKDHNWALTVARQIKRTYKTNLILLGGPHPHVLS